MPPVALAQSMEVQGSGSVSASGTVVSSVPSGSGNTAPSTARTGVTVGATASVTVPESAVRTAAETAVATAVRLPLRAEVRVGAGYTSQLDGLRLDGSMVEYAGSLGWIATPWLSIEARGGYLSMAHRFVDADADGRVDSMPAALTAVQGSLGARLRWFHDDLTRYGWSLSAGFGYLYPLENYGARGGGFTLEGSVGRHVGVLTDGRMAFELGIELRGRTGLGAWGDWQNVQLGVTGAWEGDQDPARSRTNAIPGGYRLGHTFGVELSGGYFPGDPGIQGTSIRLGSTGGGVSVAGGLVLAGPFELMARAGYIARTPQREGNDLLHGALIEGGTRFRWGWLFAEIDGGIVAPFGTLRDRVQTTAFAGGALGARIALSHPDENGLRLLLGARTRVGLFGDHAFDAVLFTAGLEWEGDVHAPPLPRVGESAEATASVSARVSPGTTVTGTQTTASVQVGEQNANVATGATVVVNTNTQPPVTSAVPTPTSVSPSAGWRRAGVVEVPAEQSSSVNTLPVSVGVGVDYGYIAPVPGFPLERTVTEWSLALSWTPTHWLALDARGAYWWAAGRTEDRDNDGRSDWFGDPIHAVQLSAGPRLRLLYDEHYRHGWTLGLYGGYWIPVSGFGTRGGGMTLEAAVARHVATITDTHNAFGLSLEVRGRTGLGALGDVRTLTLGVQGSWEGNVAPHRSPSVTPRGYRPGHTFALDVGMLAFLDGGWRPNGRRFFEDVGYSVGMSGGVVLARPFELTGRIGYLHRNGSGNVNALAAATIEAGPRVRYGWLAAHGFAGYAAVFGTQRWEVASGMYAGGSLQARFEVADRWNLLLGLNGRVGLGNERALDHIGLSVGVEFEGGNLRADPFPTAPPPPPSTVSTDGQGPGCAMPSDGADGVGSQSGSSEETVRTGATGTTAVSSGAATSVQIQTASAGGVMDLPMRFSLGYGMGFNRQGVNGADLDGSHGTVWVGAGWVPARWLLFELNASYFNAGGHAVDNTVDGRADAVSRSLMGFAGTLGARVRLLREDVARYGWSFGLGGGVLITGDGFGPLGEAVLGHHVGVFSCQRMVFELGLEARARLGYLSGVSTSTGIDRGGEFHALTVGFAGAWEGNARPSSRDNANRYAPGETLHLESGYALFLPYRTRVGNTLDVHGYGVAWRTGVVFTPALELSARAGFVTRSAGEQRDPLWILLAELGPRVRWGWTYGELTAGYAGGFGTHRDGVNGSPLLGLGLGVRLGLTGPGRHIGFTFGVLGRMGLSDERAYDHLLATFGLEFEGGHQQAAPFPAAVDNALRMASDVAAGRATVQANVGVEVSAGTRVPTLLAPGYTLDIESVGRSGALEITTDDVMQELPVLRDDVRTLRITVSAPSGVDAVAVESVVTHAVRLHYHDKVRVTVQVIAGARRDRFALSISAE